MEQRIAESINPIKKYSKNSLILNTNFLVANEYAAIRKNLKDIGKPIPENDIWIAAICNVNDIKLATRDKHFKNIKNLKLARL